MNTTRQQRHLLSNTTMGHNATMKLDINGARVTFGAGGVVTAVTILSDMPAIQVKDDQLVTTAETELALVSTSDTSTTSIEEAGSCTVCWCDPEDPVMTTCGHGYCKSCFEHQATADEVPLRCVNISEVEKEGGVREEVVCGQAFSISELQTLLPNDSFMNLRHSSFRSYIRSRPTEFRPYPTIDCPQVYRLGVDHPFNCTSCLSSICRACRAPSHPGITCAERKDIQSGGIMSLEEWKMKSGAKQCPNCKALIEKDGGCSHVHCIVCETDMCWYCGEQYTRSTEGTLLHDCGSDWTGSLNMSVEQLIELELQRNNDLRLALEQPLHHQINIWEMRQTHSSVRAQRQPQLPSSDRNPPTSTPDTDPMMTHDPSRPVIATPSERRGPLLYCVPRLPAQQNQSQSPVDGQDQFHNPDSDLIPVEDFIPPHLRINRRAVYHGGSENTRRDAAGGPTDAFGFSNPSEIVATEDPTTREAVARLVLLQLRDHNAASDAQESSDSNSIGPDEAKDGGGNEEAWGMLRWWRMVMREC